MKYLNGRTIVVIAVILGSLFWAFVISNFMDEPLRPEVRLALEWHLPAATYEDNGYLILLGMNEPPENDALDSGKRILENELLKYQNYLQSHSASSLPVASSPSSPFSMSESLCDYQQQHNCVDYYLTQSAIVRNHLIEKNKFLLDRYHAMRKCKNYVDAAPPYLQALIPSFTNVMNAAKLEHVLAISEVSSKQYAAAMHRLLENSRFSHRLLRDSDTIVSHIVALAMIKNDIRILSELLQKYPQLIQYTSQFAEILAPISSKDFSIAKGLIREQKNSLNTIRFSRNEIEEEWEKKDKGYLKGVLYILFNENATLNLGYDLYRARIEVSSTEAHKFEEKFVIAEQEKEKLYGLSVAGMVHFNNPVGKILLRIAEPNYKGYVERQHDTEGYVRLVSLQYKLIVENIHAEKIPEFLKKSGREYSNPYTLEPMRWDAENFEVSFEGHQTDKNDSSKRVLYTAKLPRIDSQIH